MKQSRMFPPLFVSGHTGTSMLVRPCVQIIDDVIAQQAANCLLVRTSLMTSYSIHLSFFRLLCLNGSFAA